MLFTQMDEAILGIVNNSVVYKGCVAQLTYHCFLKQTSRHCSVSGAKQKIHI